MKRRRRWNNLDIFATAIIAAAAVVPFDVAETTKINSASYSAFAAFSSSSRHNNDNYFVRINNGRRGIHFNYNDQQQIARTSLILRESSINNEHSNGNNGDSNGIKTRIVKSYKSLSKIPSRMLEYVFGEEEDEQGTGATLLTKIQQQQRPQKMLSANELIEEVSMLECNAVTTLDNITLAKTATIDSFLDVESNIKDSNETIQSIQLLINNAIQKVEKENSYYHSNKNKKVNNNNAAAYLKLSNDGTRLIETDNSEHTQTQMLNSVQSLLEKVMKEQKLIRHSLMEAKAESIHGLKIAEKEASNSVKQAQKAELIITSLLASTNNNGATAAAAAATTTTPQPVPSLSESENRQKKDSSSDNIGTEKQVEEQRSEAEEGLDEEMTITSNNDDDNDINNVLFNDIDLTKLSYDDVNYELHEMSPPFINEDQCLVPGETIVRVEKAPDNSRRIFAGIDIDASVDDVWNVLTNYPNLHNVVPNLAVNEVIETYDGSHHNNNNSNFNGYNVEKQHELSHQHNDNDAEQCKIMSKTLKGCKLKQVGVAKVIGINFSARTTLEVREWPMGMPDFAHYEDEEFDGKSRNKRAKEGRALPLKRYQFPRPFALSTVPYKCISMQSIENDSESEFRIYQGVWRMQPLPGCAPPNARPEDIPMRLTYAVEISPRPYLPVALVENRIAQDLCANLEAIRDFVSTSK